MSANGQCYGQADSCTWDASIAPGSNPVSLQASQFTLHLHNANKDYVGRASTAGPSRCTAPANGGFEHSCDITIGFDIPAGDQIDGQTLHVTVDGRDLHAANP